ALRWGVLPGESNNDPVCALSVDLRRTGGGGAEGVGRCISRNRDTARVGYLSDGGHRGGGRSAPGGADFARTARRPDFPCAAASYVDRVRAHVDYRSAAVRRGVGAALWQSGISGQDG